MHIMSAMFDQDEIFAAYVAEARADEYARGIVEMGREFGLSDDNILTRLSAKLNCSQAEAQDILREVQG